MEKAGSNCFVCILLFCGTCIQRAALPHSFFNTVISCIEIETARSVLHQLNGHKHTPLQIREVMRSNFGQTWNTERLNIRKLTFYNMNPKIWLNSDQAHTISILQRDGICNACLTDERDVLDKFAKMQFVEPIIEDEIHVLRTCSLYEDYLHRLSQNLYFC